MKSERAFTLLEVMLVMALVVPLVSLILGTTMVSTQTLEVGEAEANTSESLERTLQRVASVTRACLLSTYRVEANEADVSSGRASAVGQWIDPVDLEARSSIRFQSAAGVLAMNAAVLTEPRTIRLVRDAKELANGLDDDGDGLVDEGRIELIYEGERVDLARNVESCTFTLERRLLRIDLHAAKRRADGRVVRAGSSQSLFFRNN